MSNIRDNANVVLTGRRFPDGTPVRIEVGDGCIQTVQVLGSMEELGEPPGRQRWVTPGFYDLQVNGFAGVDLGDPNAGVAEVRKVCQAVLSTGCTRFLPTIITGDLNDMCQRLETLAQAMESDPLVEAMCPGMHVEGPFIRPEDGPRGAHPREHVRAPNLPDFRRLEKACRGRMRILTLAPEQPGASEVIRAARAAGVTVALGHHRADQTVIDAAIAAGARMCTHLGNGADALLPRNDNYIWWQLGEDRLWATFVADGHHLPPATLRVMLRAKTLQRSVLITDAMAAAGMPPGRFPLGYSEVVKTLEEKVCLPGTPYLAGSAAEMPLIIVRAVADGGLELPDAVELVTRQPARLIPTPDDPWSCSAGRPANLVEFDWDAAGAELTVRKTVLKRFSA